MHSSRPPFFSLLFQFSSLSRWHLRSLGLLSFLSFGLGVILLLLLLLFLVIFVCTCILFIHYTNMHWAVKHGWSHDTDGGKNYKERYTSSRNMFMRHLGLDLVDYTAYTVTLLFSGILDGCHVYSGPLFFCCCFFGLISFAESHLSVVHIAYRYSGRI